MISIFDSLVYSLIGIAIVFAVLFILIVFIKIMSLIINSLQVKANKDAADSPKEVTANLAKGSCGGVNIFDVPDKTAAMLMAVVAEKTGKPLNTLRFISIRDITHEEKDK